jgi:hypothetical protein
MKTIFFATLLSVSLFSCQLNTNAQPKPVQLPWEPRAIAVDQSDNLFIEFEDMLLKITADGNSSYVTENIGKDFRGSVRPYCSMMAADQSGNIYMIRSFDNDIWKMSPDGKFKLHVADSNWYSNWAEPAKFKFDPGDVEFMVIDKAGNIYYAESLPKEKTINNLNTSSFHKITMDGQRITFKDKGGADIKINQVDGIGVDGEGNLYVSNVKERCIKKLSLNGDVNVVAGQCGKRDMCPVYSQGDINKAELVQPGPIVFNQKGELFFADIRMNRIIKVADKKVTTVAGSSLIQPCGSNIAGRSKEGYKDGKAGIALFNFPEKVQLAIDSKDNIYILDGGNNAVRKLTPAGIVTTVAKTAN